MCIYICELYFVCVCDGLNRQALVCIRRLVFAEMTRLFCKKRAVNSVLCRGYSSSDLRLSLDSFRPQINMADVGNMKVLNQSLQSYGAYLRAQLNSNVKPCPMCDWHKILEKILIYSCTVHMQDIIKYM